MIELVVVLGIVLILTGISLPSLARTMGQARLTRMMIALQGAGRAVTAFAHEHEGAYPISDPRAKWSMWHWYEPIVEGGYLDNISQADPIGVHLYGTVRTRLSANLMSALRYYRKGESIPFEHVPSSIVRQSQVAFPSSKGMMVQHYEIVEDGHGDPSSYWCCATRTTMPVVLCDGSSVSGSYSDFLFDTPLDIRDDIGIPVMSSWGGYEAMERRP